MIFVAVSGGGGVDGVAINDFVSDCSPLLNRLNFAILNLFFFMDFTPNANVNTKPVSNRFDYCNIVLILSLSPLLLF